MVMVKILMMIDDAKDDNGEDYNDDGDSMYDDGDDEYLPQRAGRPWELQPGLQ